MSIDLSLNRIRVEQRKDADLCHRIDLIKQNPDQFPTEVVEQNILFRLLTRGNMQSKVPWIPISLVPDILFIYHDHPMSGHFGLNRTYKKIRDKFFWIRMYDNIKEYIQSCKECAQFNVQRRKKPGFLQQEAPPEGVFEIMRIDFWKAPIRSSNGNQYVLVITDRLSKYVFARATPSATAKEAAAMLFEDIILKHGSIQCLQSDQGSHFKNELLSAISQMIGCVQVFSIPYHPMSNGQVERFNATFCDQLKKYSYQNLNDWDIYLPSVVWAYNSTVHATTKFIPYELAFNRHPIFLFDPRPSSIVMMKPNDYWERANRFKRLVIQAARTNIQRNQTISKHHYDQGRIHPLYNQGELVWAKLVCRKSKFDPRFHGPFIILNRINQVKYLIEHTETDCQQEEHVNNLIPFHERD